MDLVNKLSLILFGASLDTHSPCLVQRSAMDSPYQEFHFNHSRNPASLLPHGKHAEFPHGSIMRSAPWWLRIISKIFLSRLPISYGFWRRLRLFKHGDMHIPERAWTVLLTHAQSASVLTGDSGTTQFKSSKEGTFVVLELGPGDSLFSGMIARSLGATHTWLVDTGNYAIREIGRYREMANFIRSKGFSAPDLSDCSSLDEVLNATSTSYLTNGVRSLQQIPDQSIDFCFSNAVLEHVDLNSFSLMARELRRVLKPTGRCCHRVDLKDHLGGGLNNLRFSKEIWESSFFKKSGFYTNRLRFSEIESVFLEAGFQMSCPRIVKWEKSPISRSGLHEQFRAFSNEDLSISGFDMILWLYAKNN